MALISLRQLLECGAHFGHPTRKWNPKMAPYIFTKRNGIHILDLQQTTKMIDAVHDYIVKTVESGGKVLFVGTKKQAQDAIKEEAAKCGMPYVNTRWLGGTLTNFRTIRKRVLRLLDLREKKESGYFGAVGKKEAKGLIDELNRLEKFIGGLVELDSLPQALFIIDVKKEENAIHEARKLGIPVIGILDSNCNPDLVDYIIIGNDDAIRSIRLFCQIISDSVLEAKHGYLPPDSVLIQSSISDDEPDSMQSAEAMHRAAKSDTSTPVVQPEHVSKPAEPVAESAPPPAEEPAADDEPVLNDVQESAGEPSPQLEG